MPEIVFIVCGGGAMRIIEGSGDRFHINPICLNIEGEFLKTRRELIDMPQLGVDYALEHVSEINNYVAGARIVVVFSLMGGSAGTGMLPVVLESAKAQGCKTVSIIGIPMQFESERRNRALSTMSEVLEFSDRVFIMDIDTISRLNGMIKFRNLLDLEARTIAFMFNNLVDKMDGPFFSTFPAKVYTFSYITEIDPVEAVNRSIDASMFETDPAWGKMIVMVGSDCGSAEADIMFETIVSISGIIPDIVKRSDRDDAKVLVFLPVDREEFTSSKASRT